MYRRRIRRRRYRRRYGRYYRSLLLSAPRYGRKANTSVGRKAPKSFGKVRRETQDDVVALKPGGYLRGYKGPVHMSVQMERVAKAVAGRQWRRALSGSKRLEYKGFKFKIPSDYMLMRAANYAYYPLNMALHAKAHAENMRYVGPPGPKDEL
jgi:hypothetical protein